MPGLNASVVFQVLDSLDGVDLVLGLNFFSTHCVDVMCKNLSLSIPHPHGPPVIVKSAPQALMFESFSTEHLDVVSGSRLAHLVAHEDCDVFLGHIKELNNPRTLQTQLLLLPDHRNMCYMKKTSSKSTVMSSEKTYHPDYHQNVDCGMDAKSNTPFHLNQTPYLSPSNPISCPPQSSMKCRGP
jgi:hypothetical protein